MKIYSKKPIKIIKAVRYVFVACYGKDKSFRSEDYFTQLDREVRTQLIGRVNANKLY